MPYNLLVIEALADSGRGATRRLLFTGWDPAIQQGLPTLGHWLAGELNADIQLQEVECDMEGTRWFLCQSHGAAVWLYTMPVHGGDYQGPVTDADIAPVEELPEITTDDDYAEDQAEDDDREPCEEE